MVHGYKVFLHIWSILGWSQSVLAILTYNLLIRSGRLYGQFFLDKTWTLQAGSTVHNILLQLHSELEMTDGRGGLEMNVVVQLQEKEEKSTAIRIFGIRPQPSQFLFMCVDTVLFKLSSHACVHIQWVPDIWSTFGPAKIDHISEMTIYPKILKNASEPKLVGTKS